MTGHALPGRTTIRDRKEALTRLYAEHFSHPKEDGRANGSSPRPTSTIEDEQVIELCRQAKNSDKFVRLFDKGDTNEYGQDDSRADQALVSLMAFYTQNPDQLDRLFRDSALYRPEKWGQRPDYRRRTIEKALGGVKEICSGSDNARLHESENGHRESASPSLSLYKGSGRRDAKPEVVKLADIEIPGPRRYLLEDLVPATYVTLLHGDGGSAKSMLALALGLAVAGNQKAWLNRSIENGPVLYLDFELDAEEQARRVNQLSNGAKLSRPSDRLLYMSALGHTARVAFEAAFEVCEEHGVKLLVLDSLGPALQGDAEAAKDVIGFFQEVVQHFRALGVSIVIIDHQSKLQAGQSYQGKGAFGSVFKSNLARSVLQVEPKERSEGTLVVTVRQKKHNFGSLAEPFGIKFRFSEESVTLEAVDLEAAELAEEETLNAPERVKLALEEGPAYPREISESTGIPLKTVNNTLSRLRKQGIVESTGEKNGRAEQVKLSVPTSQSHIGTGRWDDKEGADRVEGVI